MVQNKIRLGRPLAFDREEALDAAMNLFWDRGYHAVGLSDLEARTGLNRSSLYNSFGSKDVLFALALERYTEHMLNEMLAVLASGSAGLADIESFVRQLGRVLKTQAGRGCFMVNTMAGALGAVPDGTALAKRYIAMFLQAVSAALGRAVERGEIAAAAVNADAQMLLGVVLGANLLARARQPQQLVEAVLDSALAQIRGARPISRGARGKAGTAALRSE